MTYEHESSTEDSESTSQRTYEAIQPYVGATPDELVYVEDGKRVAYSGLTDVQPRSGPNVLVYEERTVEPVSVNTGGRD